MKAKSEILQRIKIRAEDELLERIEEHPFYRREIAGDVARELTPRALSDHLQAELSRLLKDGTELTRGSHGALFRMLEVAGERLGVPVSARLFKIGAAAGGENATIVSAGAQAVVSFISGILSIVDREDLLLAIVGHELGHHGFAHHEVAPAHITWAATAGEAVLGQAVRKSRTDAELLRVLRSSEFQELSKLAFLHGQVAELNADRAGLLVQPDLMPSIEAAMVLAGGGADRFGRYRAEDYLRQARELLTSGGPPFDQADCHRTHPNGPHRALAQEFFASTEMFRELTGCGPASYRAAEFDQLLPWIVPVLELKPRLITSAKVLALHPFLEGDHSAPARALPHDDVAATPAGRAEPADSVVFAEGDAILTEHERAVLTWLLGLRIVGPDGAMSRREEAFLMKLVRPRALAERVISELSSLSEDQIAERTVDLLSRGQALHGRTKVALVKMMIEAGRLDRKVTDEEIRAIAEVGEALDARDATVRELRNVFGSRVDIVAGSGRLDASAS